MISTIKNSLFCSIIVLVFLFTSYADANTSSKTTRGNWWDKFGKPQYGGEITLRTSSLSNLSFDPHGFTGAGYPLYCYENLFGISDWTLDPSVHPLYGELVEPEYYKGWLVKDWEQTDPHTVVLKLHEGIFWQDKEPVNGREFTADDVEYSYDRLLGSGHGFTEPSPFFKRMLENIEKVTAVDKYTVRFKLKKASATAIYQVFFTAWIVAPEWGNQNAKAMNDWHNAVGTGAWLISDYVDGNLLSMTRNPNYWGYDQRHPENKLPYIDSVKVLAISDQATVIAALRTAKIDMLTEFRQGALTWQQAANIAETNSEIVQSLLPSNGVALDLRCDREPFSDIRVRKAMQLAIDTKIIAKVHYGGLVDGTIAGLVSPLVYSEDWVTPYDQWPADIKAEYIYDKAKAKSLLAEAGYPDGFNTTCVVASSEDTELLEIIQSMFKEIGVNMKIQAMEFGSYRSFIMAGKQKQMVMNSVGTAVVMDPSNILSMRYSKDKGHNQTFNNDSHYDAFFEKYMSAASIEESKRICKEADMYAISQHWSVNICATSVPMVWQPWIKGYNGEQVMPAGLPYFTARWWVEQKTKSSLGN